MIIAGNELTEKIIAACLEVSNELDCELLENIYEMAAIIALRDRGLKVKSQVPIEILFRNQNIGNYYCDILVNDKIILEIKAINYFRDIKHNY